jgi:asparagine synthetase B (glutamine-hydrolysing)
LRNIFSGRLLIPQMSQERSHICQTILYRQKEQFSDGVGYGWIDALKDNAELHVTDEMMKNPKPEWGTDIPDTKEA